MPATSPELTPLLPFIHALGGPDASRYPGGTTANGKAGAKNAALLVVAILALSNT